MKIKNLLKQEVKLVPLNKNLSIVNNNIPEEFIVKNFYGHQYGVLIAQLDKDFNVTNDVLDIGEELINNIIYNKDKIILEDEWYNTNFEKFHNIYLPYAVEDHSIFEPTINFEDIPTRKINEEANTVQYYIEACIVLNNSSRIYNRYINFKVEMSVDEEIENGVNLFNLYNLFLEDLFKEEDTIKLEMYDEVGEEHKLIMDRPAFINNINSLRLIEKINIISIDEETLNNIE